MIGKILEGLGILALLYIATGLAIAITMSIAAEQFDIFVTLVVTLGWPILLFFWAMYAIALP